MKALFTYAFLLFFKLGGNVVPYQNSALALIMAGVLKLILPQQDDRDPGRRSRVYTESSPLAAPEEEELKMLKADCIHLRVTKDEKALLAEQAKEAGCSLSTFLLERSLANELPCDNRLKQQMATALCKLNLLIETLDDSHTRKALKEWEATVWRF